MVLPYYAIARDLRLGMTPYEMLLAASAPKSPVFRRRHDAVGTGAARRSYH